MDAAQLGQLKMALDICASQYGATDRLCAYFSTVTIAVPGFTIASDKVSKSFIEASIVACAYILFCIGTFNALYLSQRQLIELAAIKRAIAKQHDIALTTLAPLPAAAIGYFYWAVVGAICIGILVITWHRN